MFRTFLKIFALFMLVILAAFYVQLRLIEVLSDEVLRNNRADARDRFVPIFYFLERELTPQPREAWPRILESHRAGFVFPPHLGRFEDLRKTIDAPTVAKRLEEGKVVFWDGKPGILLIMKRVAGTDDVLMMDVNVIPSIRTEATIMNLAVEGLFIAATVLLMLFLFGRDLRKLSVATEKIGRGEFDFHADIRPRAPLGPLAASLNAMKERIAALLKSHRNLTNAVSHEFRTPITRLRFRHELARGAANVEEKDRQLDAMTGAIDQLDDLARELLEYARLDRETPALDVAPIDAPAWLAELVQDARELARAESRSVEISVGDCAESVEGDYRYLSRAAGNLLRNAVRYAAGAVRISVVKEGARRELRVDDDGPGIPAGERGRLFEPFARMDASRDRDSGGFGMGLAIVQQIARWHGGSAAIGDSPLGGARVTLSW